MKEKSIKKIVSLVMALFILTPVLTFSLPALAAVDTWGSGNDLQGKDWTGKSTFTNKTGLGEKDPRAIAAFIINIILGFLGIIAVVIILLGGFKWMTAGGNEDKVGEAKKLITAGIIGLVIILASFGIATFVISQLGKATGGAGA